MRRERAIKVYTIIERGDEGGPGCYWPGRGVERGERGEGNRESRQRMRKKREEERGKRRHTIQFHSNNHEESRFPTTGVTAKQTFCTYSLFWFDGGNRKDVVEQFSQSWIGLDWILGSKF